MFSHFWQYLSWKFSCRFLAWFVSCQINGGFLMQVRQIPIWRLTGTWWYDIPIFKADIGELGIWLVSAVLSTHLCLSYRVTSLLTGPPYITLHTKLMPGITLHTKLMPGITLHTKLLPGITLHTKLPPGITLHTKLLPGITLHTKLLPDITLHTKLLPDITLHTKLLSYISH